MSGEDRVPVYFRNVYGELVKMMLLIAPDKAIEHNRAVLTKAEYARLITRGGSNGKSNLGRTTRRTRR